MVHNANNQVTTFAATTLTYDLNGNLTGATDASGTATYTWNARNQLVGITGVSFSASFAYDSLGRRTAKTINGGTTNYLYDGLNVVQEKNGAAVLANLLMGLGIDEVLTRTDSAGTRGFLTDALDSTIALIDNTGIVQTQYAYEPFGAVNRIGAASQNSYKFTGREDDGSGLYYYRARYYHPRLQRFISEDPIGFKSGAINFYAYSKNRPMTSRDPLGLTSLAFDRKNGLLIVDPERAGSPVYGVNATSGAAQCMNNPQCSRQASIGPLPSGAYTINAFQISNPPWYRDILRWFAYGDWGDWLVPIHPNPGTDVRDENGTPRRGFFLHGGFRPGSAGCIDFGGGYGTALTDRLLQDLLQDPDGIVPLTVR